MSTKCDDDWSIINERANVFATQDGGSRHLELLELCISGVIDMFQIEVTMYSLILGTIGKIVKKCSFSKYKMAAAAILKSTLPIEPPSREMISWFVIFNQKYNFYCGILMLKGNLLSGALMLKRFFCKKSA